MLNIVKRLWKEEEGQGLAEYALILAFVALLCVGALFALGNSLSEKLDYIAGRVAED